MTCPKCNGEIWDNRAKKAAGEMKPNAPDFSCRDKVVCKWVQWPPKKGGAAVAVQAPQSAPEAPSAPITPGVGVDAERVALYWNCLDTIMAGIATRKLTDLFKPESVVAMVATLYIQRSKG